MRGHLSREQVRELDRRAIEEYGVPSAVLMENAGRGAAELLIALAIHGRVLVVAGKGNNAGDGFVMARHLANRGIHVHTLLAGSPEELSHDALVNYRILERGGYSARILEPALDMLEQELRRAEWIVDALFGTGLRGPVRAPYDKVIEAVNARKGRVLAVDIPSGLDCDTGQPLGPTIRADHTATFAALKVGFTRPEAAEWVGRVHLVDIGLPQALL